MRRREAWGGVGVGGKGLQSSGCAGLGSVGEGLGGWGKWGRDWRWQGRAYWHREELASKDVLFQREEGKERKGKGTFVILQNIPTH